MATGRLVLRTVALVTAMALTGCGGASRLTSDATSVQTPTVTAATPRETTESLAGVLVRDDADAWYLELDADDRETYGASRLSVMTVEGFTVACQSTDRQLPLDELPARLEATVEFVHVLDSDPISLPPMAILADC